jgi:hypothetical protein
LAGGKKTVGILYAAASYMFHNHDVIYAHDVLSKICFISYLSHVLIENCGSASAICLLPTITTSSYDGIICKIDDNSVCTYRYIDAFSRYGFASPPRLMSICLFIFKILEGEAIIGDTI